MSEMTITNPDAQEAPGVELKVYKHHVSTRVMHACVAIGFIYCAISGLLLFFGVPIPRAFIAISHCILGMLFIVAPIVYMITNRRSFSRFAGTIFHYDKDDAGWITAPMGGYLHSMFLKRKPAPYVPPQDKYNTGQKLAGICLIIGGVTLAATGLLMWANTAEGIFGAIKVHIGSGGTWLLWTVHFGAAVFTLAVFAVHFFLAAIFKETRVEFGTMFGNGLADYAYTKKKHGKWLQTLTTIEEKTVEDVPDDSIKQG